MWVHATIAPRTNVVKTLTLPCFRLRALLAACDASAAPSNGATGNCTTSLASGATCQPTCAVGYTASGDTKCSAGNLTAATCNPHRA